MGKTRIFLADDHPIVRKGIKAVFSDSTGYEIVGEAEEGIGVLKGVTSSKPDVVIMDISMPELDGIVVTERISREHPGVKVIILSMHPDRNHAIEAFRAGAKGYIIKGGDPDEILLAVDRVMQGVKYTSPELATEIMSDFVDIIRGEKSLKPVESLSLREREVIKLIAEGYTSKEIAEKLFLSPSTVKSYRIKLMKKLDVNDVAGLVKVAIRSGLVKLD